MPQRRVTHPAHKLLYAMLALQVVVCWALYGYYFLAQQLKNPMPVTGQFVSALVVCLMGFFYYLMMVDGRAYFVLILFLTPFFTLGFVLLYVGVRGLIRAARGVP